MAEGPEKKLLNIKCVFLFSLQLVSEKYSTILAKMYTGLHVEYHLFLSDFNQNLIFSQFSKKSLNIKFHENMFSGSQAVPCRWTDRQTYKWMDRRDKTKDSLFTILHTQL